MQYSVRLKDLRLEKKLTQKELALLLNLTSNSICEWEKGRSSPGIESLKKLSEIFECSIDYLVGNSDDFGVISIKNEISAERTPDGKELIDIFNSLDSDYQAQILEYARYFASRSTAQKKKS